MHFVDKLALKWLLHLFLVVSVLLLLQKMFCDINTLLFLNYTEVRVLQFHLLLRITLVGNLEIQSRLCNC